MKRRPTPADPTPPPRLARAVDIVILASVVIAALIAIGVYALPILLGK